MRGWHTITIFSILPVDAVSYLTHIFRIDSINELTEYPGHLLPIHRYQGIQSTIHGFLHSRNFWIPQVRNSNSSYTFLDSETNLKCIFLAPFPTVRQSSPFWIWLFSNSMFVPPAENPWGLRVFNDILMQCRGPNSPSLCFSNIKCRSTIKILENERISKIHTCWKEMPSRIHGQNGTAA